MFYYPFHIGDYTQSTNHLTNDEDLAYRRLIDFYMNKELPITQPSEWLSKRLRVSKESIEFILNEFFTPSDRGLYNFRCDLEIGYYYQQVLKNQHNGIKGGRPKNPVGTQWEPSGNPVGGLTKNQEPRTNNHSNNARMARFDEFWSLYPKKTAKEAAKKAWVKINDEQKTKALLTLPRHINTWSDPQFIPHPATWINQHRFDDVLTTQVAVTAAQKDYVKPKETESEKEAQRKTLEKLQSMVSQKVGIK